MQKSVFLAFIQHNSRLDVLVLLFTHIQEGMTRTPVINENRLTV